MYSYNHLFNYLPVRFNPSGEQLENNREVYRFKDGNASERIIAQLAQQIKTITAGCPSAWVVAFIPASTSAKTRNRYLNVAAKLAERTGVNVVFDAIYNLSDRESSMVTGKVANPTSTFAIRDSVIRGKKVLLIDDVITRGTSFTQMGNRLMSAGAASVFGLFLAKTVSGHYSNVGDIDWQDEFDGFDPSDFIDDFDPYEAGIEDDIFDACFEEDYFDEGDIY